MSDNRRRNSLRHSTIGGKNPNFRYYEKIDLGGGKYRYFYTKAEYDTYMNNRSGAAKRSLDLKNKYLAEKSKIEKKVKQSDGYKYGKKAFGYAQVAGDELRKKANDAANKTKAYVEQRKKEKAAKEAAEKKAKRKKAVEDLTGISAGKKAAKAITDWHLGADDRRKRVKEKALDKLVDINENRIDKKEQRQKEKARNKRKKELNKKVGKAKEKTQDLFNDLFGDKKKNKKKKRK